MKGKFPVVKISDLDNSREKEILSQYNLFPHKGKGAQMPSGGKSVLLNGKGYFMVYNSVAEKSYVRTDG